MAQFQADSISDASRELLNSEAVERIFILILALGNYMNKGARGNSPGFKLSSLNKLRDTKSQDGKSTLLHYLVSNQKLL
jgi:dishevelled associated activator of morphogenesis